MPLTMGQGEYGRHVVDMAGDLPGCVLVFQCQILTVNYQVHEPHPEQGTLTKGSGPSGMKVWVTPPDKPP